MRKKLGIILAVILAFDVVAMGVVLVNRGVEANAGVSPEQTAAEQTTAPLITKVSFVAVGDNLIHDTVYEQAENRANGEGYDFSYAYSNIADYIAKPDIAILNQETLISTEHQVSSYPCFNSPEEVGEEMMKIGFDVFNIATNHSLDKGESGLISTINYWKQKGQITTGAYLNQADFKIPTKTVNDITFAFLGFTEQTNGLSLPANSEVVLVHQEDEALLQAKIAEAKKIADCVIVNAHWGEEYTHTPNDMQKNMAQKLADWGVDVVIGTHPHVIQPVEFITSTDGAHQMLVAYSLGNFISAQNRAPRMLGGMLNFNIVKNNSTGKINVEDVRFSGTVTHYGSGCSNIRVYPLSEYTDDLAQSHGVKNKDSDFSLTYLKELLAEVVDAAFLAA